MATILWVGLKTRNDWGESWFRFKMAGKEYKFEDFLHFIVTFLQDFLSVRGLSKPGKKTSYLRELLVPTNLMSR